MLIADIFIARQICSAFRARYCFRNSVRLSIRPSSVGIVSKVTHTSSHFLMLCGGSILVF